MGALVLHGSGISDDSDVVRPDFGSPTASRRIQRCRPLLQLARPYFFRHVVLPAAKSFCRGRSIMEHDLAYISNLEKAAAAVDGRLRKRYEIG